jgi:ascorbate-specific PTS system EIIC-type component UlaA
MYDVITLPTLPLGCGIATLFLAGYYESRAVRVPSKLMLACLFIALLFAGAKYSMAPQATGGLIAALIGMVAGGVLMIPLHFWFDVGKGCITAMAAFGAWLSCAIGVSMGGKVLLITATCAFLVLVANVTVHKRLPDSDPEHDKPVEHGQLPVTFGAVVGLLATIWL